MNKKLLSLALLSIIHLAHSDELLEKLNEPIKPAKIVEPKVKTIKQDNFEYQDILNKPITVNVRNVSLSYLLSVLSENIKFPIVLRDIPYPQVVLGQGQMQAGQMQVGQMQAGAGQGGNIAQSEYLTVSYVSLNKPLKYVLDEITGMLDLWWKKEDDRIVIYKYERKVFYVALPYLQKSIDEKNNSIQLSYKREFIKNLDQQIRNVLTDPNSKVSVDEMGNIMVSARKSEMVFIEEIVKNINERFTKEIPLKVKVFLVKDEDFRDIGIGTSFKKGSMTGDLTSNVAGSVFNLSILTKNIEVSLNALGKSGKAKIIEDNILYALNGQPIVYSPLDKKRIVSNISLTYQPVSAGTGTTSTTAIPTISVQTEDIESGNTMIIVPYYVSENTIAVDLYRKQQSIEKIETQNIDLQGAVNTIALPYIKTNTNLNQTTLRKGQTLALFSSDMTLKEMQDVGIPFLKDIPLLGYLFSEKQDTQTRYRLIITLTYDTGEGSEGSNLR